MGVFSQKMYHNHIHMASVWRQGYALAFPYAERAQRLCLKMSMRPRSSMFSYSACICFHLLLPNPWLLISYAFSFVITVYWNLKVSLVPSSLKWCNTLLLWEMCSQWTIEKKRNHNHAFKAALPSFQNSEKIILQSFPTWIWFLESMYILFLVRICVQLM